uniref:Riboflavin kinase n=2 Tax=Mandrillus leucophaeus TaxID=9568 RepID=A0A2K5YXC6_MANLE
MESWLHLCSSGTACYPACEVVKETAWRGQSPPISVTGVISVTDRDCSLELTFEYITNFPEQVVDNLPADISTGIYYGWASVGSGDVHKMVVSIGWNPYYKNTKKSMETHIMHTFKEDFYGEILNVAIVGYLRPEKNFDSLESLISAIQGDIEEAKKQLDLPEHLKVKEDNFFQVSKSKIMNGH